MLISKQKFLSMTKDATLKRGWPWVEPIKITEDKAVSGEKAWRIRTNMSAAGRNVRIVIRKSHLAVIEAMLLPR